MTGPSRAASLVCSLALLATVAACGDDDASSAEAADESPAAAASSAAGDTGELGCAEAEGAVVGYSEPLPDPNFQFIEQIIDGALSEYGASLEAVNANLDPGKQIADIQSLIDRQVDVIIANPVDPNATKPAFDQARAQDIPVIAQETTIGGPFFTNVTADVESAAAGGAELLKQTVGDGRVTAVAGPAFAEVIVRENEAFAAAAAEVGLDVADTQVNQTITPQAAQEFGAAWQQQLGDELAGVWTFNDTSAVGVASAFTGEPPAIVSINGQPEVIPLIEDGRVLATFDIQQDKLGQALAYAALAAICGREVPEEIVVPVVIIDASNVAEYRPLAERVDDPFEVVLEERDGRSFVAS